MFFFAYQHELITVKDNISITSKIDKLCPPAANRVKGRKRQLLRIKSANFPDNFGLEFLFRGNGDPNFRNSNLITLMFYPRISIRGGLKLKQYSSAIKF